MIRRKIVITGTHITPALELIRQLLADSKTKWEITYIGRISNSSVSNEASNESIMVPRMGVKFVGIKCGKFDRRWFLNTIAGIPDLFAGFVSAFRLVTKIKPEIIVSFGGYVSVPVVVAGFLKSIPSITHEQTLTSSLSTRINSYLVKKVALTFDDDKQIEDFGNKSVVTGNLIRKEIFDKKSEKWENLMGKTRDRTVLVTAGNQGSSLLNEIILEIAPKMKNINWIHQTGRSQFEEILKKTKGLSHYFPVDYIEGSDIGWVFNKADLVICRGGANTAQDLVALGKKTIMIPLPVSAKNEQRLNCRWVKSKQPDRTEVIEQENLTIKKLQYSIKRLLAKKVAPKKAEFVINNKLKELIYEMV